MNNHSINKRLDYLLTGTLLFLSIYLFMATANWSAVFNADQMSISYFYRDLIQHHGTLGAWQLSNTNYLFPDTFILFFYNALVSNFRVAILLADCTILAIYYFMMVTLGTLLCGKTYKNVFRLFALGSLVMASGHLREQEVFMPLLVSHFGSNVIMYLVVLYLILRYLTNPRAIYFNLLIGSAFLTNLSDPLAMLLLTGSTFVAAIGLFKVADPLQKKRLKKICVALLMTAIASIFALKLHLFYIYTASTKFQFVLSKQTTLTLYHIFLTYYQHNALVLIITGTYLVLTVCLFFILLFSKKSLLFLNRLEINGLFFLLSTGSCIAILGVLSWAFDYDLLAPGFTGLRHFNPAILIPAFLALPVLLVKYTPLGALLHSYYTYLTLALLCYVAINSYGKSLHPFIHYYPPFTDCLDTYYQAGKLHGKTGVSWYWDAHPHSLFSKNEVTLVAVNPDYSPYDWMATKQDYLNKTFYFTVLNKQDPDFAIRQTELKQLGRAETVLTCPQAKNYLIYPSPQGFSLQKMESHVH